MANSNIPLLTGATLFTSTSVAATAIAVSAASNVVYEMELDNTANSAATYLKAYNTGTVSVGTTAPDFIQLIPASTKITLVYPSGVTFGTALTIAALTAGGTAGTTPPTSAFAVKIVYV